MKRIKLKKEPIAKGKFVLFFDYGGFGLKMFIDKYIDLNSFYWGVEGNNSKKSKLIDSSLIQNIYADENMAPRVFDLVEVDYLGDIKIAQLVEKAIGGVETRRSVINNFSEGLKKNPYSKYFYVHTDPQIGNLIGNKYVDFQGFSFLDFNGYKKEVLNSWELATKWKIDGAYQDNKSLGVKGRRNIEHRLNILKIEPQDKIVVDIGCSGGQFVNWCSAKGAKESWGFDLPEVIKFNQKVANIEGVFNVNYTDNKDNLPKADVVLFLSMHRHIGYPDWVHEKVKSTLYFEGNHNMPDKYEKILKEKFEEVVFLGNATDFQIRPNFLCRGPK